MARMLPGLQTPEGTVQAQCPVPGVLTTRVTGFGTRPILQCLMDSFDLVAAEKSPVIAFHDWFEMEGYDPSGREPYIRWSQNHRSQVEAVHILIRSKLVAMVISVANLKLGYLHSYSDPGPFEQLRVDTVLRRRASVVPPRGGPAPR